MEGQEGINNSYGVTPKREEAPEIHRAPATDNVNQLTGSAPVEVSAAAAGGTEGKKKRGRPRKYAPDGTLSPTPISASIPLTGDFSAWKQGRGRPIDSFKKKHKLVFETPGKIHSSFRLYES